MGVVTARAAGVGEVVVCSPPGAGGAIDPVVLGACELAGAGEVYRMGGAQAVAALALGTEAVPAVDVIVGPGNLYVQEAKRQLSGQVGIDSFAGPSDLLVIADGDVDPEPIALDMLAQDEHGPGTLVVCASPSGALLSQLRDRLAAAADTGAVARLVEVPGQRVRAGAGAGLRAGAPRAHRPAGRRARRTDHPGRVRVRRRGVGDGLRRLHRRLQPRPADQRRGAVRLGALDGALPPLVHRGADPDGTALARAAAPIARAEGFELHARSMEARIGDD